MREIRQSGSEGGGDLRVSPYPYRGSSKGGNGRRTASPLSHRWDPDHPTRIA